VWRKGGQGGRERKVTISSFLPQNPYKVTNKRAVTKYIAGFTTYMKNQSFSKKLHTEPDPLLVGLGEVEAT
jgi:hypothetical protein